MRRTLPRMPGLPASWVLLVCVCLVFGGACGEDDDVVSLAERGPVEWEERTPLGFPHRYDFVATPDDRLLVRVGRERLSQSVVLQSDDGGDTWHRSQAIRPTCNESQVVELADGTLMINMRSQDAHGSVTLRTRPRNGYRSIAVSRDGGETWTDPAFDEHLGDPVCQAGFIRYSLASDEDQNRLLFSNPSPPISPERGQRIRMTVRLSYDEGKTWPVGKLVHDGPSAYSCLARLPDGRIGILYEAGEKGSYESITFARFDVKWLTDGKDSRAAKTQE